MSAHRDLLDQVDLALDRAVRRSGRPPDWVTEEAREELLRRMRARERVDEALISTSVFLAETDDAPALDAETVRRAAELERAPAAVPRTEPVHRRIAFVLLALVITGGCVVGLAAGMRGGGGPPAAAEASVAPVVVRHAVTMAAAGPEAETRAPVAAVSPAPAATTPAAPVPVVTAPAMRGPASPAPVAAPLPEVAVGSPPLPPDARPLAQPAVLRGPMVLLRYRYNAPGAAGYVRYLERQLHAAGLPTAEAPLSEAPPRTLSIRYYHWQDFDLARQVALTTTTRAAPRLHRVPRGLRRVSGIVEIVVP